MDKVPELSNEQQETYDGPKSTYEDMIVEKLKAKGLKVISITQDLQGDRYDFNPFPSLLESEG